MPRLSGFLAAGTSNDLEGYDTLFGVDTPALLVRPVVVKGGGRYEDRDSLVRSFFPEDPEGRSAGQLGLGRVAVWGFVDVHPPNFYHVASRGRVRWLAALGHLSPPKAKDLETTRPNLESAVKFLFSVLTVLGLACAEVPKSKLSEISIPILVGRRVET